MSPFSATKAFLSFLYKCVEAAAGTPKTRSFPLQANKIKEGFYTPLKSNIYKKISTETLCMTQSHNHGNTRPISAQEKQQSGAHTPNFPLCRL